MEVLTASLQERSQRDRREPEGRCGSTDVQAIDLAVLLGRLPILPLSLFQDLPVVGEGERPHDAAGKPSRMLVANAGCWSLAGGTWPTWPRQGRGQPSMALPSRSARRAEHGRHTGHVGGSERAPSATAAELAEFAEVNSRRRLWERAD
jgi:hypothetical protein